MRPWQQAGIAGVAAVVLLGAGHAVTSRHTPAGRATASTIEHLGLSLAAARGWTGHEANCLNWLWTRESGWRMVWNFQGSGAFGIAQALPPSKMASAGADYMTNPRTDIRWGLGYIAGRYGDPCGAWAHETSHGWY
jgi:hypothetical protein